MKSNPRGLLLSSLLVAAAIAAWPMLGTAADASSPVQCKDGTPFDVFDVSDHLRRDGWQVPAYTMPEGATDVTMLRIVVREGFSADLARALRDDTITALSHLDELKPRGHFNEIQPFAH